MDQTRAVFLIGVVGTLIVGSLLLLPGLLLPLLRPDPGTLALAPTGAVDVAAIPIAGATRTPRPSPTTEAPLQPLVTPTATEIAPTEPPAPTPVSITAEDAAIRERLLWHLECLTPQAQYDGVLDAVAQERAVADATPPGATGSTRIYEDDGTIIIFSGLTVADLVNNPAPVCGETLDFGLTPLDWPPDGATYSVGLDMRDTSVVLAVVWET